MSVIGLSSWRRRSRAGREKSVVDRESIWWSRSRGEYGVARGEGSRRREESGTDGERGESRLMMAKGEGYIPCKVLAGAMMVLTIDSPRGNPRARVGYTGAAWREDETMTWRER
jgi:hypothetical protein